MWISLLVSEQYRFLIGDLGNVRSVNFGCYSLVGFCVNKGSLSVWLIAFIRMLSIFIIFVITVIVWFLYLCLLPLESFLHSARQWFITSCFCDSALYLSQQNELLAFSPLLKCTSHCSIYLHWTWIYPQSLVFIRSSIITYTSNPKLYVVPIGWKFSKGILFQCKLSNRAYYSWVLFCFYICTFVSTYSFSSSVFRWSWCHMQIACGWKVVNHSSLSMFFFLDHHYLARSLLHDTDAVLQSWW